MLETALMILVCGVSMLVGQVLETHLLPFWWKNPGVLEEKLSKRRLPP